MGRNCCATSEFSGVPRKGDKFRIGYITPAFSGRTSYQNGYMTPTFSGIPRKGDKTANGYITCTFSGAHNWGELLHNPGVEGGGGAEQGTK